MLRGWMLDVYADEMRGLVLWILGEDGQRHELIQDFPITFYVAGDFQLLRDLWQCLKGNKIPHKRERVTKQDSTGKVVEALAVTVISPLLLPRLFREVERQFPQLTYYDADMALSLRYAAATDIFPMSFCEIETSRNKVLSIAPLDSRWDVFPKLPRLRVMRVFPDVDPDHAKPTKLTCEIETAHLEIVLRSSKELLSKLQTFIDTEDPDLILSDWGDTWLFPLIEKIQKRTGLPFNPNRDKSRAPRRIKENSYFSYGRTIYRGKQTHLFGRWHVDRMNAMTYGEYGISGAIEQANITSVPVQEMSRKSPGAGITAMFTITSLRRGVLVPYEKLHVEQPKTLMQLNKADRGGLIYQPTLGLHRHVIQIDFSSMYPSIMALWNVSPETVGVASKLVKNVPDLDIPIDQEKRGIVSETLAPLLQKRLTLKSQMTQHDKQSIEYRLLESRSAALKWLLVVCFGYQGYKNFREGRIEAHETITAFSRWALFQTMRIIERKGFKVLHMYVDSVWLKRADESPISAQETKDILDTVFKEIGLPITTEASYRWVAFLPARMNPTVPVPNRYFGELADGSFKVRGTASRRHDTPNLISSLEGEVLALLAGAPRGGNLGGQIPTIIDLLRARVEELKSGLIPNEDLVFAINLSKPPEDYKVRTSGAVAGRQLQSEGKKISAGQAVKYVYVKGFPRVFAWDSAEPLDPKRIDIKRYAELIIRMASEILQPIGITESMLLAWVIDKGWYGPGPGEYLTTNSNDKYPLFEFKLSQNLIQADSYNDHGGQSV